MSASKNSRFIWVVIGICLLMVPASFTLYEVRQIRAGNAILKHVTNSLQGFVQLEPHLVSSV